MTEKMYEMICEKRFNQIDNDNKKIIESLLGNGHAGLSERVRVLERTYTKIMAAAVFVLCAVMIQVIEIIFRIFN